MESIEIIVSADGKHSRHLYSEIAADITSQIGPQDIQRASHVEPVSGISADALEWLNREQQRANNFVNLAPTDWIADLRIVNGPVLGPFNTRQAALDAEAAWLHEHRIPVCPTGSCASK